GGALLPDDAMRQLCAALLDERQQRRLRRAGQLDCALTTTGGIRLRANFFYQRAGLSLALRRIAERCPTLAQLQAPAIIPALTEREEGLILVTGATGSGKSTTLAAMIDHINRHQRRHILTLEAPVEFIHYS